MTAHGADTMKTLLLSRSDVRQLLTMRDVISAVKEGYLAFQEGGVQQPDIVSVTADEYNGETDIKTCLNRMNRRISVKTVSGFYNNGKINDLPTMIGTVQLFDATDGSLLCVMDGSLITGIRTGAAGAVSCEYLAREDAATVCVIGCGGQARMQVYGLCHVRNIKSVRVYSPHTAGLTDFKTDVERETGAVVTVCDSAESALRGADVVITATPSKEFLVPFGTVSEGTHIVAVGADMPGKNELDPRLFRGAKIVCDSIAQCVSRGETRNALQAGVITEGDIYAEIGEIVAGSKAGRTGDEITIFDTTGMAVQDNVVAATVYELASARGLGKYFEFI